MKLMMIELTEEKREIIRRIIVREEYPIKEFVE
jgi:stress response protein YsnF